MIIVAVQKAIRYSVNIALMSWSLIADGLVSLVSPRPEVDGGWVSSREDKGDREGILHTHPIPQVIRLELFLESR